MGEGGRVAMLGEAPHFRHAGVGADGFQDPLQLLFAVSQPLLVRLSHDTSSVWVCLGFALGHAFCGAE
jgi:hypothetical protein